MCAMIPKEIKYNLLHVDVWEDFFTAATRHKSRKDTVTHQLTETKKKLHRRKLDIAFLRTVSNRRTMKFSYPMPKKAILR